MVLELLNKLLVNVLLHMSDTILPPQASSVPQVKCPTRVPDIFIRVHVT